MLISIEWTILTAFTYVYSAGVSAFRSGWSYIDETVADYMEMMQLC